MSRAKYFFSNAEELLSYLKAKLDNPTPLKIQKSLYFLWAFYAATYGSIDYSHKSELLYIKYKNSKATYSGGSAVFFLYF